MLTIYGKDIERDSYSIITVPVAKDLGGIELKMKAHVVAGAEDGPTLLITSMLHGEEWFSVLIIRELLRVLDRKQLKGNIIAIPVVNESSFNSNTRCLMDGSDEPDANRSFGGRYNWLSNQITRTLEKEFLCKSDYLIDYHIGSWGSRMADIGYGSDYEDKKTSEISRGMAMAYGFPVLDAMTMFKGTHSNRNSMGFAGSKYGIPGIVPEIGGLGFGEDIDAGWIQDNIKGILGNLRYLGMLDGEPEYCEKYLQIHDYWRISPKNGGYIEVMVKPNDPLTMVKKDQLLANVIDPETFEVMEELRSPGDGYIFYGCRDYMCRPGGWVFGVTGVETSSWLFTKDVVK